MSTSPLQQQVSQRLYQRKQIFLSKESFSSTPLKRLNPYNTQSSLSEKRLKVLNDYDLQEKPKAMKGSLQLCGDTKAKGFTFDPAIVSHSLSKISHVKFDDQRFNNTFLPVLPLRLCKADLYTPNLQN